MTFINRNQIILLLSFISLIGISYFLSISFGENLAREKKVSKKIITEEDPIHIEEKLEIDFTLVNPAFYDLEVGSIINFDNTNMYPSIPFGVSNGWSDLKFMITKTGRTIGKISVTARQIS